VRGVREHASPVHAIIGQHAWEGHMASSTPDWSALASQNEKLVTRPGAESVRAESADCDPAARRAMAPHPRAQPRRRAAAAAAALLGGLSSGGFSGKGPGGGARALSYKS
jgi:hypothetical protein